MSVAYAEHFSSGVDGRRMGLVAFAVKVFVSFGGKVRKC